ncbi:unnamed protein product [Owenia fusiformis]|uniref:NF-kappa-B inhibitor-like protein 1 n=1 Tax=Owenia fusiformis TaxID=6347 RepID=A0A8J1Y3Z9_OWEFU|nr:unnamed protein product [Owenia fusiformis]
MNPRQAAKVKKYITKDNRDKFKYYMKKHRLSKTAIWSELGPGWTVLHYACSQGAECIMRYMLKHEADCMLADLHGNLPIHIACQYARTTSQNRHVYTDLLLPLIQKCPKCLDVTNSAGRSAREILQQVKHNLQAAYYDDSSSSSSVESTSESLRDNVDPPDDVDHNGSWSEKLGAAMEDEYYEEQGMYEPDYSREDNQPETYDDWAENMKREFYNKHKYQQPHYFTKPHTNKKQKLNEEKEKRKFTQKLQTEHEEYKKRLHRHKLKDKKQEYEANCCSFFTNIDLKDITFKDIPWPGDVKTLSEFLSCDFDKSKDNNKLKKYFREQQIRWHPDKFSQKVGGRLKESDRERIMEHVKEISQALNVLLKE